MSVQESASSFGVGGQQRLDAQGNVDMNIPVRAINRSAAPVTWLYAREKYTLLPGVPMYIPYMAMVYWQGDPRAIDLPGGRLHEQYRRQHREHLRATYGVYENDEKWANIPLVECYPIDSDVRFETVLLDPDGTSLAPEMAEASEVNFLRNQLAAMQSQMAHLAAQIQVKENADDMAERSGMTSDDLDHQVTTSKAIAPEHPMVGAEPTRRVAKKAGAKTAVTKDA